MSAGDSCRYELSIELSHELNPLRVFSDSEIPPDVDNKRPYDLLTAQPWVGADKSIVQINEPEKECFLFYSGSKESDVDAVVRLAGQTKNVLAIVLIRKASTSLVATLPLFVVKWAEIQSYIRRPSGAKISIRAVSPMAQQFMADRPKFPPLEENEQHTVIPLKRRHDADDSTHSSPSGVAASHADKHMKTTELYQNSPSWDPEMGDHSEFERDRGLKKNFAAAADPYQVQQSTPSANDQGSMMGVEVQLDRKKSAVSHPLDESDSSSSGSKDDSVHQTGTPSSDDNAAGGKSSSTQARADSNAGLTFGESDQQSGEITPSSSSFDGHRIESRAARRKRRHQEKKNASSSAGTRGKSINEDENPTKRKESKNILTWGVDLIADAFRGPEGWNKVLGDLEGWSESHPWRKTSSKRYTESMDRFDKAFKEQNREKMLEISREVHEYLQHGKCTLLHLAFAARVFLNCAVFELATTVLVRLNTKFKSMDSTELANAIQRSSKDFKEAARKPGNLFNAFFKRVFKSWDNLGPFPVSSEGLLICIFECWVKCGMFQCKNINWNELRFVVSGEDFSLYDNVVLQRSLGIPRARTLGLLLCENVDQVVRLLAETNQTSYYKRSISVDVIFANCLVEHITEAFECFEGHWDAIGRIWSNVCIALGFVSFPPSTGENCFRQVLSAMVDLSSFRERKSFQFYLPVIEAVRPETRFYDVFLDLVRESLFSDIRCKAHPPHVDEFLSMLGSRTGEVLSTWNGERSILDFMKSAIIQQACLMERFIVIGRFFDILFTKMYILKSPGRLVPLLISFVREQSLSKQALWIAAFQVAKSTPLLFKRCGDEQVRSVAELILTADHGLVLLEQPQLVVDLLHLEEDHVPGPFYVSLQARVEVILRKAASSIDKACRFYLGSHNEASNPASMAVAERIFLGAFSAWNPSSITAIVDKDESTLALLFRCFHNCPPPVAECGMKVTRVVNEWYRAFQENEVTRTILHDSLQSCKKAGWQSLGAWAGIQLPTESTVAEKLDEIDGIAAEVIWLLSVQGVESTSTSLSSILKGYNCHPTPNSELDHLLSRYEPFLSPNSQFDRSTFLDKSPRLELRQIHRDRSAAAEFSKNHGDAIHVCDYFLKNPSALFRKSMSAFTKEKMGVEALQSALERTLKTIGDLFGLKTTFKNVNDAVKLIASSGGSLEKELKFLTGCPALQLTTEDQERFKAVALMSRFSGPLDRFIKFCRQFKFAIVQADPCFKQLEEVSVSLVSEEVLGLDAAECMDFSTRLVGLLCPGTYSTPLELHSLVEDTLHCVNTLGALSTHSEIWTFAREMNWFDREGLKRFYAEYNNCTNVLLGNTASYEMSVLDALQPTIRAISLIGSLQDAMDIRTLFESLRASSDVKKCSQGGTSSDLDQVQSNLSQIREWFTNGVDDVAAVYGMFQDVCRTGEYSIQVQKDKKPMLTLVYQNKDERKLLQGQDLVGFVQHVSLIQHEDECIADEVTSYAELHMMLSKAANNFVEMLNLGFDVDIGLFTCCAGSGQLDQARELLQLSDVATRNHERQLQALRENYRVSALFFTDELKKIFDIGTVGGPDSELWPEFVRNISRLLHTSGPKMPWEERSRVCSTVVSLMKQDLSQTDTGWLRRGSKLVENLHGAFGNRAIPCDASNGRVGRIVLHTLAFEDSLVNGGIFCLLRHIYKDRLPERFEILDAMDGCSLDHLEVFLRRAQMFPSYTFVIINVDQLTGNRPEKLVSFLSRREVASSGIHLHCIQRKPSLLHTGPWVDGVTWDSEALQSELDKSGLRNETWKRLILDHANVDYVRIIWTPSSGTGKTLFTRNLLDELRSAGAEVASVTIHEESSVSSLLVDLSKKFSPKEGVRALHFNFCYLPDRSDDTSSWLESMNRFFFSLLILRSVHDPMSGQSFHLGERSWKIFVELPAETAAADGWLRVNIPTLEFCGTRSDLKSEYHIDKETRRVCTYLRAYSDGTINRKFVAARRQIMFVIDRSPSMDAIMGGSTALGVAMDNALRLFDSHVHVGDIFGLTMFTESTSVVIPLQEVASDIIKANLRRELDNARNTAGSGTQMYHGLLRALMSTEQRDRDLDTWIVCLTDGESGTDSKTQLQQLLQQSSDKLRILLIGINLRAAYENEMRNLCGKYRGCPTGCFVPSNGTLSALNAAFAAVASRIPVSQTFELFDGVLSDDECRNFLRDYTRPFLAADDMLMQTFWVNFLFRRVNVFDLNTDFNENVHYDQLGSTLMETMLEEVKRLLAENQRRDWIGENHAQLVYDFSDANDPKFRLVCTSPDELSGDLRKRYEALDLPGFSIPTKDELSKRATLDRFLSQALGVPLHQNEDGEQRLKCIDEHGFILTLDFTMKLLNMHERVACRVPCLIEGETGVSKTALTKMYSILRNSSLQYEAKDSTELDIYSIEQELQKKGFSLGSGETALLRLQDTLASASQNNIGDETEVAGALHELLMAKQGSRPTLFQAIPDEFNRASDSRTNNVREFLIWYAKALLEPTFFEVNVDASLTQEDVVLKFLEIRTVARKLLSTDALVVVFLDEINTSSIIGVFKEIVVDRTLMGEALEENIVVVAACNPFRTQATTKGACLRENDLGREWASGHYQVVELPVSLKSVRWNFGSLSHACEKDFILRRIERLSGKKMPMSVQAAMTEVVANSHEAMRRFASKNILTGLLRVNGGKESKSTSMETSLMDEAAARASSVVSLRDIQRVFALYKFFSADFNLFENGTPRDAMMLAVAVVYYLRLDDESRDEFKQLIQSLPTELGSRSLQTALDEAMDTVIARTEIPKGIALTKGLKENVFMTLVCLLSRTPLLIVGPPGTSKTLAVNITSDNSNGEDSPSEFYRKHARLSLYHYQCSKQSTSKEIAAVFEKATQRQGTLDPKKHLCFVFMDEAGLPEEEKESLKVLHYLLEGHMSATSEVGFVGISNHVLDAAKSNRCVMLLRQEPDTYEMLSIAKGVLFDSRGTATCEVEDVVLDGEHHDAIEFATTLCRSYAMLLQQNWFETFFGLRDFIYFLKALRVLASFQLPKMTICVKSIVNAIERNFNGVTRERLRQIALSFLEPVARRPRPLLIRELIQSLNDPLEVIRQSLCTVGCNQDISTRSRYKLIIDKTDDDSVMRLLGSVGIVDLTKKSLFKLSQLPEDVHVERMRLVAGVKFAALQGKLAVLSQTEPVNEAMYDLFNQRFHVVGDRLFANIAIGGVSRRCLVRPSFDCVVHVRESQLHLMPAPFLNRFEKYTLGTEDVLKAGWSRLGKLATVFDRARDRVSRLLAMVPGSGKGMFGWVDGQTLDSLFIDLLPKAALMSAETSATPLPVNMAKPECFADCLSEFLSVVTSVRMGVSDVEVAIDLAKSFLRQELLDILLQMSSEQQIDTTLVRESLHSLVQVDMELGTMAELCSVIIQMVVTRVVVTRVIQIASPEAVYLGSTELPSELVSAYFFKEHFNLRRVIEQSTSTSTTNKVILYARSDAAIRGIPSYSMSHRGTTPLDTEGLDKIKELVHGNVEELVIEHISTLRSETMLRTTIEAWIKDDKRKIFLLLVDMGTADSVDHANFARTFVEQRLPEDKVKIFVMLLHHPPSIANRASCYPALFLQGWNHVFLDGIGSSGPSLGVETCIELACKAQLNESTHPGNRVSVTDLSSSLQLMLPRVVSHVATHMIFNAEQIGSTLTRPGEQVPYRERYRFLMMHMSKSVDGETVGAILCSKFAALWLDTCLLKTMRRASEGLLLGRTQLSLSMSVRSNLLDTFDAYLLSMVKEMNQGQSLNILSGDSTNEAVETLFGLFLRSLAVAPFDELVLLRKNGAKMGETQESCHFPFFPVISQCLDDLLDLAAQKTASCSEMGTVKTSEACMLLHKHVVQLLSQTAEESVDSSTTQKRVLVGDATRLVNDEAPHDDSLFERYLHDFISWKTNCSSNGVVVKWLRNKLKPLGFDLDIVGVHVITKTHEKEFMSVASWSITSSAQVFKEIAEQATVKNDVLEQFMKYFERSLGCNETNRGEWSRSFARFLRQTSMLASKETLDKEQAYRLRILCFFYMLLCCSAPESAQSGALQLWYDRDQHKLRDEINEDDVALSTFMGLLGVCDKAFSKTIEMTARHFFSPRWVNITTIFREQDFLFLLDYIAKASKLESQLNSSLLRGACFSYGSTCDAPDILGMPAMPLHLINCQLHSSHSPQFSSNEKRVSFPHFLPNWLRTPQLYVEDHHDRTEFLATDAELGVFFTEYAHCFDGKLPEAVFNMILQAVIGEAETLSSEALLLSLLQDIEAEGCIRRDEYTRLARIRSRPLDISLPVPPCRGSLVSAMILDARLICFISKTALELATQKNASALAGTYGDSCRMILELTMSIEGCRWSDFFFHTILQARGEGTLASLVSHGGVLHTLSWCKLWSEGAPAVKAESQQELERAESELADALQEEHRKTRELRLCPHCGNTFIVALRACGTFKCGSDAHGGMQIGGAQVRAIYGCGQQFNIDGAPHYVVDESMLDPLRAKVEQLRNSLLRCDASASLWEQARVMEVPILRFCVEENEDGETLFPTASVASQMKDDTSNAETLLLLQRLRVSSDLAFQHAVLPDLIELYVWLHGTFRYLVTKTEAMDLRMKDIMDPEKLCSRFDVDQANHIMGMWNRASKGLNNILKRPDVKIFWQCEEIEFPFNDVGEAPLLALLSEGDHPTDGNDFLFLIINTISDRYNSFVRWMGEFESESRDSDGAYSLHPKFVMRGSYGAVVISELAVLSETELDLLIERTWDSESQEFDTTRLNDSLKHELLLHVQRPLLINPMSYLRERFFFRNETQANTDSQQKGDGIANCRDGAYFANPQDVQLYDDVCELLRRFVSEGYTDMRRTLEDAFHKLDYNQLRSILEGARSILQLFVTEGVQQMDALGKTLCPVYNLSHEQLKSERVLIFGELGFPDFNNSQFDLLVSLKPGEFFELVRFVGFQLASEAYQFCGLPLGMKEPLGAETLRQLHKRLEELKSMEGLETAVKSLDEFVRDVLSFYEVQICEALSRPDTRPTLRFFLLKNNFCDDNDTIFALLPPDVSLRNYASLRCHLHQLKLGWLVQGGDASASSEMAVDDTDATCKPQLECQCWLWDTSEPSDTNDMHNRTLLSDKPTRSLWFLRDKRFTILEDEQSVAAADVAMVNASTEIEDNMAIDDEGSAIEGVPRDDLAAKKIQRCWRRLTARECVSMEEDFIMDDFADFEDGWDLSPEETFTGVAKEATPCTTSRDSIGTASGDGDGSYVAPMDMDEDENEQCLTDFDAADAPAASLRLYGSADDESNLRRWLNEHKLPQTVADGSFVLVHDK